MIKIYCLVYDKYRKLKNPKVLYVPKKKLGFPIVCSKCDHKYSIPIGIPSSVVGLRICVISAGIKKYKSINHKKKKKHDKRVLLVKNKLGDIQGILRGVRSKFPIFDPFSLLFIHVRFTCTASLNVHLL